MSTATCEGQPEVDLDFGLLNERGKIIFRAVTILRAVSDLGEGMKWEIHREVTSRHEVPMCDRTVLRTLEALAAVGLVDRMIYPSQPSWPRYRLTPRGRDLVR